MTITEAYDYVNRAKPGEPAVIQGRRWSPGSGFSCGACGGRGGYSMSMDSWGHVSFSGRVPRQYRRRHVRHGKERRRWAAEMLVSLHEHPEELDGPTGVTG